MFTGIIEETGTVLEIERGSQSAQLRIECQKVLEDTRVGDSIAVNGVCLTVTTIHAGGYTADVMAETLNRSTLASLKRGSRVNLERAMAADGRFGGHIVAGHVDGVGEITKIECDETAIWYRIAAAPEVMRYIVEKGSITVDGISLTVARVNETDFTVSVIPHTQANTTLREKQAGDFVNLETDVIGKYVEKLLYPQTEKKKESKLTMEFLRENGV